MRKAITIIMSGICMMPLLTVCGKHTDTMKSADIFAMDTYMNLKAYGRNSEAAVAEAKARIYGLEQTFSVTDEASDIWKINHADGKPVTVSADTVSVLQTAQQMNNLSGGALCISLYPILRAWGFTTGEYRIPENNGITNLLEYCDDTKISVTEDTVQIPNNYAIDLGAVAKGYTGDAVMEIMQEHHISSAIINLGGNVQALGSKPDSSAWTVGITDPFAPDSLRCVYRTVCAAFAEQNQTILKVILEKDDNLVVRLHCLDAMKLIASNENRTEFLTRAALIK